MRNQRLKQHILTEYGYDIDKMPKTWAQRNDTLIAAICCVVIVAAAIAAAVS